MMTHTKRAPDGFICLMDPLPRTVTVEKFFFFNDTATTEIYTLSLHDALPIYVAIQRNIVRAAVRQFQPERSIGCRSRSEEHTSELQSRLHLVCRLLLEKKNDVGSPRQRRDGAARASCGDGGDGGVRGGRGGAC